MRYISKQILKSVHALTNIAHYINTIFCYLNFKTRFSHTACSVNPLTAGTICNQCAMPFLLKTGIFKKTSNKLKITCLSCLNLYIFWQVFKMSLPWYQFQCDRCYLISLWHHNRRKIIISSFFSLHYQIP